MLDHNVIILTTGLAGSSAVAGLLSRVPLWTGDHQFKKHDYNTWENNELVEINKHLIKQVGLDDVWMSRFDSAYSQKIIDCMTQSDRDRLRDFLLLCDKSGPWLWKDPRLWLTFPAWHSLLGDRNVKYILVKRDPLQSWISMQLRRKIGSYFKISNNDNKVNEYIREVLNSRGLKFIEVLYEDLSLDPEGVLKSINGHIGSRLTMNDLRASFSGSIGKKQHGLYSLIKAIAIFTKNSIIN